MSWLPGLRQLFRKPQDGQVTESAQRPPASSRGICMLDMMVSTLKPDAQNKAVHNI